MKSIFFTFVFGLISSLALASPGDDLYAFQDCIYQCEQITCRQNPYHLIQEEHREALSRNPHFEFKYYNGNWQFDPMPLPFHLRLLGWNCESNCDYQCQRVITAERVRHNEEIYQFHGKWPFLRIFGIQELVSVIMSLGNLYVNYLGFKKVMTIFGNSSIPSNLKYQFVNILITQIITMLAWIFSSIFHTRDYLLTEHLDYYFAGLTVLSQFHALGARYFKLYRHERIIYRWMFALLCIAAYGYHFHRLYTDWSYTYNMRANITVGLIQNVFYILVCFSLYTKYYNLEQEENTVLLDHLNYIDIKRTILPSFFARSSKLFSLYPILLCFIVLCGMSMEIFDFPPFFYDLVDAHSIWHLITIVPAYMGWYDWLVWDVYENVWPELQAEEKKKNE
ncbi:PER1 Protein PER1 [Candida maltosa Xu316]|uniref:Post-GPI attachment to proteins factor 3 n=1 Tax=Candida maltosa (strain Xu316) TaxID=1245528 RepID=M3JUG4_CANMX|nr:hypothetical protein G210_3236 [Candida maltosa Xu316]